MVQLHHGHRLTLKAHGLLSFCSCACCQVNHQRVRCGHKSTGWTQHDGHDYITCHFKDKPDVK